MSVITIRGQLGSGAPEIGKRIASILKADYVDREIITMIADQIHRTEAGIEEKEMPAGTFKGRLLGILKHNPYYFNASTPGMGSYPAQVITPILDDPTYFSALLSVIESLANEPSIIICGRGSQFILQEHTDAFHVLVVAPLNLRIKRIMAESSLNEDTAREKITNYDSSRREFIKKYFKAELGDPLHYDLVINTAYIDYQAAGYIVINALPLKKKQV